MLADFNVQEPPSTGEGKIIVLQDAKGNGIQILITPYSSDTKVLTADDVCASIPDMKVTDDQVVEVGNNYKGVAFKSNNDAFGGASREVGFVFLWKPVSNFHLRASGPPLQSMFSTWRFF